MAFSVNVRFEATILSHSKAFPSDFSFSFSFSSLLWFFHLFSTLLSILSVELLRYSVF